MGKKAMNYFELASRDHDLYRDEHLSVDVGHGDARLDGREMVLTRKEKELLSMLVSRAGEVITRDELLMKVWGYSREIRTRTLDVHIRRLRKKLDSYGDQYIETVFGVGYRFQRFRAARRFSEPIPSFLPATA